MTQRFRLSAVLVYVSIIIVAATLAVGQSQTGQTPKEPVIEKSAHAQLTDFSGNWELEWQGRLGVEHCALHLKQDGTKLSGTFQDLHGVSALSGTVDGKQLTFEVQFKGPHPFTTRFTGTNNISKIEGTSQAVGVGTGGAYLGHGGEIVQPEHPWTATPTGKQSVPSADRIES